MEFRITDLYLFDACKNLLLYHYSYRNYVYVYICKKNPCYFTFVVKPFCILWCLILFITMIFIRIQRKTTNKRQLNDSPPRHPYRSVDYIRRSVCQSVLRMTIRTHIDASCFLTYICIKTAVVSL